MYDSSKNHVAFVNGSVALAEQGGTVGIPVIVSALPGDPPCKVYFNVDNEQSEVTNGYHYTIANDPMELDYPNGWGYDTIWVTPVDNETFSGNRSFVLRIFANSMQYPLGAQDSIICTIVDDEHPLGNWIGTYDVTALSYGSPGAWDEFWAGVTTEPDPNDVTKLVFSNVAGGDESFSATFNLETMTISIPAGTLIGDPYGNGDTRLYNATPDLLDNAGDYVTEAMINAAAGAPLEGTIAADGSIHIDNVAIILDDYVYCWDVFDTYWTKGGKALQQQSVNPPKKLRRQ
jgi:hypothetical protein